MGVVYRALDLQTQRPVAIKRPGRVTNESQLARFRREGEALARLNHPGIVAVQTLGEERGEPYIVLQLVSGHSLSSVLRGRGTLPNAEVLRLGRCLAEALAYAHERDVLHRDVKPENILLPTPDQPVLVDFGLAKFEEASGGRLTATGALAGTPGFAAPEQLADAGKVDARADIYGLGATLYAFLTGNPPGGDSPPLHLVAVAATGSFPSPRSLRSEVSRPLSALVMRALAHDPSERFGTMAEFADALAELERQSTQQKGPSKQSLLAATVLILALVLGGVGGAYFSQATEPGVSPSPDPSSAAQISPAPQAPSPSPGARAQPALDTAAVAKAEAQLRRTLLALQAAEPAVAGIRFEDFDAALTLAERIPSKSPAQSLLLGRAHREQARWEAALSAYTSARGPGFELRADLGLGITLLSRLDGSPVERRAWIRRGREALATAGRRAEEIPPGVERGAGLLAALILRLWDLPEGIEINATTGRIKAIQAEIPEAEVLLRQEIHFAISFGLRKTRGLSIAATRLELLERAPAPRWSPGYALPFAARFSEIGLPRNGLAPTELLVRLVRGRGGVAGQLAFVQARTGLAGGLERSLAAPEAGIPEPEARRLRAKLEETCAQVGRVLGHAASDGAYHFRLEPTESNLLIWVHVPEGTGILDVQIQGAEADLDLYAEQDGPPTNAGAWRSDDLTHAERIRITHASQPPLRTGIVQVRINRYRSWPEPVTGIVVVRRVPVDAPPPVQWNNVWEVTLNGAPRELRPAFKQAHELFLRGEAEQLDDLLRPYQARIPRVALLRTKLLIGLGAYSRIEALAKELDGLGQPHPAPLRYGLIAVAAFRNDLAGAVKEAEGLLAKDPTLLDVATFAARFEAAQGKGQVALARLEALAKRDPADLRIRSLILSVQIEQGSERAMDQAEALLRADPAALLVNDQSALLASLGVARPQVGDAIFAAIRAKVARPVPSRIYHWVQYLARRRRFDEAKTLLADLEEMNLMPSLRDEIQLFSKRFAR